MSQFTAKQISDALLAHPFRFAKTMPEAPHEYTLIGEWSPDDSPSFMDCVRFIRDRGEVRPWGRMRLTYFDAAGFSYWTMDRNAEDVTLINRCDSRWKDPGA